MTTDTPTEVIHTGSTSILQFKDVYLSCGANPVLRGVSLTVEKGQVIVIIGPSGGGKSSLLAHRECSSACSVRSNLARRRRHRQGQAGRERYPPAGWRGI
ncbi:ATP-binding cassette domain-containing protein [Rhizobium sp. 1AS11]|uniref:ATP-binding cassette domain-containing protein n=1 Tax=Rhizobium acaciae TaxID=2989736 RepID=UPI0022231241|nr:ATP-binding cassette domain-containing protein [Rhizobium acaciae]MCW1411217.1 ATP-binding cassette domain-containing protein [Rhizobium acaciae]MCW1743372.1 ATP-binding cassette domain-containing protein [Rhizobium acaciae]